MVVLDERFWKYVNKHGPNPAHNERLGACWLWTGGRNTCGYASYWLGKCCTAHVLVYVWTHGPVPEGQELDHLCRVRHCVNPEHLEPVTHGENIRRGEAPRKAGEFKSALTHCPRGHKYTHENTYWQTGGGRNPRRACRACGREKWHERRPADA